MSVHQTQAAIGKDGSTMNIKTRLLCLVSMSLLSAPLAFGQYAAESQQPIEDAQEVYNWSAPLLWTPSTVRTSGQARTQATSVTVVPLPFIAITPCRVADTRGGGGVTGPYGPPSLVHDTTRNFTITGKCGIPTSAAAVSFNFAALNV